MAIKNKLAKENNEYYFDFDEVYFKIDELIILVHTDSVRIGLRGYPNKESRDNKGIGIFKESFTISLDKFKPKSFSKDDIKACAYEYLMNLEKFKTGKKI